MFIRFVTTKTGPRSRQQLGVFASAYELIREQPLESAALEELSGALTWFEKNLPVPKLSSSSPPNLIFWFKSEAQELVKHIWSLVHVLREHGVWVRLVRATDPGTILYSDDYQVAAVSRPKRRRSKAAC